MDIRQTIAQQNWALLSTVSKRYEGYPFGSIVPYVLRRDGTLIITLASLAEHYKNLTAVPKASLLIAESLSIEDPQTSPRITILADFVLSAPQQDSIAEEFFARFPDSPARTLPDFRFFLGTPKAVRWIGGFGQMGWHDGNVLRAEGN